MAYPFVYPIVGGLRLPFRLEDRNFFQTKNVIMMAGQHDHPYGAATRADFFCDNVRFHPGTFYICVGEKPGRAACLNIPDPAHRDPAVLYRWPLHNLAPIVELRDVFRRIDDRREIAYGTSCNCALRGAACDHVKNIIRNAHETTRIHHVVVLSYDVYGLSPHAVAMYLSSLTEELGVTCEFVMALHQFPDLSGTLFRGENEYQYEPQHRGPDGGQVLVTEYVTGNGAHHYGPHSPTQWVWRNHNVPGSPGVSSTGDLIWLTHRQYGPDREVTAFRMVFAPPPGSNQHDVPEKSTHYDEMPMKESVLEYLASRCRFSKVDHTVQKLLTSMASRIVRGDNPEVPFVCPERLINTMVVAYTVTAYARAVETSQRIMADCEPQMSAADAVQRFTEMWHSEHRSQLLILLLAIWTGLVVFGRLGYILTTQGLQGVHLLPVVAVGAAYVVRQATLTYYRRYKPVRMSHWMWAVALLFLLTCGTVVAKVPVEQGVLTEDDCCSRFGTYHACWRGTTLNKTSHMHYVQEPHREGTPPQLFGVTTAESRPVFSANCQCNEVTSLATRALSGQGQTTNAVWKRIVELSDVTIEHLALLAGIEWRTHWQHFAQWVSKPRLSAVRRAHLTQARQVVLEHGLDRKAFVRKAFVKIEPINKTIGGLFEEYDPRTIMGMQDELQITLGPWFTEISKLTKDVLDTTSPILYAIGRNGKEVGAWFTYWRNKLGGTRAQLADADASRLDRSLARPVFEERIQSLKRRGAPKSVTRAYRIKIAKFGFTRHGVAFSTDGSRASGDSDTSWDNTLIVIGFWIDVFHTCGFVVGRDYAFAAAGDDVVFIFHRDLDTSALEKNIGTMAAEAGLSWKLWLRRRICDLVFLSGIFLPDISGTYVVVPKPGRLLSRLGWSRQYVADTDSHIRAIALGLRDATCTVPISGVLISKMLNLAHSHLSDDELLANYEKAQPYALRFTGSVQFGVDALEQMLDRYNISLGCLQHVEHTIDQIPRLPFVLAHPVVELIVEKDIT